MIQFAFCGITVFCCIKKKKKKKKQNIVGKKGENAGNQHFLLFSPQCFQKGFYLRDIKTWEWCDKE